MRKQSLIDIVGQKGQRRRQLRVRDQAAEGQTALQDALDKTTYVGPGPVPFADYVESVLAQTIKKLVVTRGASARRSRT